MRIFGILFWYSLIWKWRTLLGFGLGMFLFEFITVLTFPAIGGTTNVQTVFEALGPDMQRLLKLVPNLQVGFAPANYLAFGYFHPIFLGLGSAFVVSKASDIVAGEIERGTLVFSLARPISRWVWLTTKSLEVVVSLAIVVAFAVLGTWLGLMLTPLDTSIEIEIWPFVQIGLNAYFLFLGLGGVALLISAFSQSAAQVAGIATAFALLAFVADFLSALPILNWLAILSPFRYYDPQSLLTAPLPLNSVAPLLIVTIANYLLALLIFQRRDIF